jgi:hypothetical protein
VDGYLLKIQTPPTKDVGNVRSYFSGHYQSYGVNVQASCDAHCRFTFIGVAGPGVMPDRDAVGEVALEGLIENLPLGYICIGDAAYKPTERLRPIYFGDAAKHQKYDNWNYYGSQCRIRIEMAFGMLSQKWGILQRPMRVRIPKVWIIVQALARLHNFCINRRLKEGDGPVGEQDENEARFHHTPSTLHNGDDTPIDDPNLSNLSSHSNIDFSLKGQSVVRERMVQRVADAELERPTKSALQNKRKKQQRK